MEKIKTIKKDEFDFDITKIIGIKKADIFENRVEIVFILED